MADGPFLLPFLLLLSIASANVGRDTTESAGGWGAIRQWIQSYEGMDTGPTSKSNEVSIPGYVLGAGPMNRSSSIAINYEKSMMHRAELDLIISYLRPSDIYLEYGAGGSTLIFPNFVHRAFTIEHDCEFLDDFKRKHADINSSLRCVPNSPNEDWGTVSKFEHANYRQFKEYVNGVQNLRVKKFDKVLIDGRARVACALRVLAYLKEDSVVFLHDFYSRIPQYGVVLKYYEEVARIKAFRNTLPHDGPIDMPQGLIVLRPKSSAVGMNLSDEVIHSIYKSIPWRYPFHAPLHTVFDQLHFRGIEPATDLSKWRRFRSVNAALHIVYKDVAFMCLVYLAAWLYIYRYTALLRYKWMITMYRNWKRKDSRGSSTAPVQLPATVEWNTAIAGASTPLSSINPPVVRYIESDSTRNVQARRKLSNNISRIAASSAFGHK